MALYAAPSVADLTAKVRRALRDANEAVFEPEQVIDFINYGLSELSLIRPLETTVAINDVDGLNGINVDDPDAITVTDLDYVWAVEVIGMDDTTARGREETISPDDPSVNWRNGWDFVAGQIVLPAWNLRWLGDVWGEDEPTHQLRVRGYRHRRRIDDPDLDVLDLYSLPEEQAVVTLAQQAGLEALMNDRSLFQQWQTATNNTDVSPTQLANMAFGAQSKWERMRKHLYLMRRPLQGAQ